jgi:hypothetical protein
MGNEEIPHRSVRIVIVKSLRGARVKNISLVLLSAVFLFGSSACSDIEADRIDSTSSSARYLSH